MMCSTGENAQYGSTCFWTCFLLILTICHTSIPLIAQSVDIAPMTWTERSDWVNVKTDPALTVHAVGNGTTDDTNAIQQALDLVSTSDDKSVVYLPAGTYRISQTLYWTTGQYCIKGRALYGCGSNTTVQWYGASDGVMFLSTGNSKARYYGIKWDGRGVAAEGMHFEPRFLSNPAQGIAEAPLRIINSAFVNFTGVALNFWNRSHTEWTGEALIQNCLFYNSQFGSQIGKDHYNNYEYIFQDCHFENCGTGIDAAKNAAQMVYNTRFMNSAVTDLTGEQSIRARHCISTGSKVFLKVPEYFGGGAKHVIQDCWIDSWTNAATGFNGGAIRIDKKSYSYVFDCKFTNPPNSEPPINMVNKSFDVPNSLLVSNNTATGFTNQTAMVTTGTGGGSANVLPIEVAPASPHVGITTMLESPDHIFLKPTPIDDSTHILDVTQAPYSADKTMSANASPAIQQAINDAKAANNGTIVYIPTGLYRMDTTLTVTGGNYVIEGAGHRTQLVWNGVDSGVIFSVDTPQVLAMRQFRMLVPDSKITTVGINVTASGVAKLTLEEIYQQAYFGGTIAMVGPSQPNPSIILNDLPAKSQVFLDSIAIGGLTINGCDQATILGQMALSGRVIVNGAAVQDDGFLGFSYLNAMVYTGGGTGEDDVNIHDNRSFVAAEYYNEQAFNNLHMTRGEGQTSGRVTLQGFRQAAVNNNTAIQVDNYQGRLFYGPQSFENRLGSTYMPSKVTHTGSNAFELVLVMNNFQFDVPVFTTGSGCTLISQYNKSTSPPTSPPIVTTMLPNTPESLSAQNLQSIAAGLDHLRELGLELLKYLESMEPPQTSSSLWQDDFSGIDGTEVLAKSGSAGGYSQGDLYPTAGPIDYFLWYSGVTAYDVSLGTEFNAVGTKPGLVFRNLYGADITTSFAGFSSGEIDIVEAMNWNEGQITVDQVKALILFFDYYKSGFLYPLSLGIAASDGGAGISCLKSYNTSGMVVSTAFEARYSNESDLQTLTDYLNNNGGYLKVTARIPSGQMTSTAKLGVADLALTLPFSWDDDFTQVTGAGSDMKNLSGNAGSFGSVTLSPQGAFLDYVLYHEGTTDFSWNFSAAPTATGSKPGLILTNVSGATVQTSFGGMVAKDINIAAQMGWRPGEITTDQVSNLVLTFTYELTGFSNMMSGGFSTKSGANQSLVLKAFPATTGATDASLNMNTVSTTQLQTFTNYLNANGGVMSISFLIPSGNAGSNATIKLADLYISDSSQ